MRLAHVTRLLTSAVVPPACAVCAAEALDDRVLCESCDRELARGVARRIAIPGITEAWAARPYSGLTRDLIAAIKFRRLLPAAARAAELIAAEAPPGLTTPPYVPVPADPLRAAWRGFDSAELIAGELATITGSPLRTCLRRRRGARQVGRTRMQRLSDPPRVRAAEEPPTSATLVDDVTTTGATLAACAAALRTAGCERVGAVVLAAAPAYHCVRPVGSPRRRDADRDKR